VKCIQWKIVWYEVNNIKWQYYMNVCVIWIQMKCIDTNIIDNGYCNKLFYSDEILCEAINDNGNELILINMCVKHVNEIQWL